MFGRPRITDTISISEMKHMREVEGMSNQQIADRLGISIGAVYSHLGKQPKEMTAKNLANKRCCKKNKLPVAESLPATELPEMPRESFKERCERMCKACEPDTHPLTENIRYSDSNSIEEAILTSKDRINEAVKSVVDGFNYYNAAVSREKTTVSLLSDRIDELVSVFGKMVVIEYIRCRLYEIGMNEDAMVIDRDGLLAKLNSLRGGVSLD